MSLETQMRPIGGGEPISMTWKAPSEQLWALGAWIDIHEGNPKLQYSQEDFEWLMFCINRGLAPRLAGTEAYESRLLWWRDRHRIAKNSLDRLLQRLGVPEEGRRGFLERGAEGFCEWVGLSRQERRALELSMAYQDAQGRPALSEIAKLMGQPPVARATVSVYLSRAKKKLRLRLLV